LASAGNSVTNRRWILVAILLAVSIGGYFGWHYFTAGKDGATRQSTQAPAPVPVTIAEARTADFPVYLHGLGTVEPYETITVHSRVDGEITNIGFKQGQMVAEGDLLAQLDPRPFQAALDQAQSKKGQDEAGLTNARADLKRFQMLAKSDFSSRQQVDTQEATVAQLVAEIKGDQAAIDNAQTQLSYTTIRSPLTGRTGFRQIDPGNIVHATDTSGIVTIVKLQPISVVFTAPEDRVQGINQALAAGTVPVTALSSDGSRVLSQGRLALVNNQIDEASGTIGMKASFENQDNALWPGLSVSTRLLLQTLKNVVVVPEDALQRGPNGFYVFVVGNDNKVQQQEVKVGQQGDGQAVIAQGLSAGQKVVTQGQYRLQQGVLVKSTAADADAASSRQADNEKAP
jgi:multidrug efflux system membrane fusion protein